MKKINTKNSSKNNLLLVIGLVMLILFLYLLFAFYVKVWPFTSAQTEKQSNSDSTSITENASKDNLPDTSMTPGKTTDQIPLNESLVATINTLTQEDGHITFSATVNSEEPNGNCSLVFSSPDDRPVTRTISPVIANGTSTCGPIKISESEFSYIGEWTATLRYFINDTQIVTTKAITIK